MAISETIVKLNGKEVDLLQGSKVAVNYQFNDIGELSSVKADYTQKIRLANTENNNKVLNNSNKIGADDKILFTKIKAQIIQDGIFILGDGRAVIDAHSTKAGYKLNVLGGTFDFFDKIKDKTLQDLDLSALNFNYNQYRTHYQNNYNASSGLCYPFVSINGVPFNQISGGFSYWTYNGQLPWIYKKTLLEQIALEAGFTITGDMLQLPEYTKCVMSLSPEEGAPFLNEDNTALNKIVDVAEWQHDIKQIDFVKNILLKHAAYITNKENKLSFNLFRSIDRNRFDALNWSGKLDLSAGLNKTFEVGFAVNNLIEYAEREEEEQDPTQLYQDTTEADERKVFVSKNKNLTENKTIGNFYDVSTRLQRFPIVGATGNFWISSWQAMGSPPLFYAGDLEPRELIVNEIKLNTPGGPVINWRFIAGGSPGAVPFFNVTNIFTGYFLDPFIEPTTTTVLQNNGSLGMNDLTDEYYKEYFQYIIEDPLRVEALFNLNPKDLTDLKALGGARAVSVDGLGGIYYVNKVKDYIQGQLTRVELYKLFR